MRKRANVFRVFCAALALPLLLAWAADAGAVDAQRGQAGEDRWVPSLAITGGLTLQGIEGNANSLLFPGGLPPAEPLRGIVDGDDFAVSYFVGASLELMTPALPIPTGPRLFLGGEILPTFASERDVALEGDPECVRGPEPGAPCAQDEPTGLRDTPFGEISANGVGTSTTAEIQTLVFGAYLGAAFPLEVLGRQLRIKPSVGWIRYEVEAAGLVIRADCDPTNRCTEVFGPPPAGGPFFLRETRLSASDSSWFDGIGPGLDVEMDAGRFGPLGVSLFLGGRAYAILGDRSISFSASETFTDQIGTGDLATADFEVEVKPWMYRAHVGIRFHWLGSAP